MSNIRFALAALPVSLALVLSAVPASASHHGDAEVSVTPEMEFTADAMWKHSFDAYEAKAGEENATLRRALAFMRAMEEAGVERERVQVAIVVHGPSVFDVSNDTRYGAKYDGERNQNYNNVAELVARGAEIWVCGVAAKYHGVGNADLLEGVKMAPSGTVAHAELQRRGFGINPY